MDRYWLLTWTAYGTWLPGDRRGFVSPVRAASGALTVHNRPGTDFDANIPKLESEARRRLRCSPIRLLVDQAGLLSTQLRDTAAIPQQEMCALAVMHNHIHVVLGVPGDPDPSWLLRDMKAYASRALNARFSRPASGTWWTQSGSKRKLPNESAIFAAVRYVRDQPGALVVWLADAWRREPGLVTQSVALRPPLARKRGPRLKH